MRWRQEFMAEVFESLLRLGLRACPVCDSAESLSMSPYPAILVDGEFPLDPDTLPEDEGGDLTFAVRIGGEYPLADAPRAHEDLAGRRSTGKLLLVP